MKKEMSNLLHHVWHMLETFNPESLEQHMHPDREEIHFIKDGVFMTFWNEYKDEFKISQANIVKNGETLYVKGSYSDILIALENKLNGQS